MKTRRRFLLRFFLIFLLLIGATGLWLRAEQRQYARNRQLIAALEKDDTKQALSLVEAGADPNTCCDPMPAPSFKLLLDQLLHRLPPPENDSPTAFMMVCRTFWRVEDPPLTGSKPFESYPQLMQAMIRHRANVNAKDERGWTALNWAVENENTAIIKQLLAHEANPNLADADGRTPLWYARQAKRPDLVALLQKGEK